MSAEEKAKDLVSKMYIEYKPSEDDASGVYVFYMNLEIAKRCALICVDEMLDIRNGLYINEGSLAHQWLLDVKQEIEKL
jgi:hypothetical protein